ncbi:hypothetical protein SCUP234_03737 [Seiridium cupressi]
MSKLIPNIRGPKLFQFDGDLADAQFMKLLNAGGESISSEGIHGRVFQVRLKEAIYAVKVFNFVSLEDIRPPLLIDDKNLISDNVIRHQLDPFFAECRAFGRLTTEKKDHNLAVRCHGYVYLSKSVEHRIEEQFGIHDWNRSPEDTDKPLRAIVKNYIRYHSFYRPSKLTLMRGKLEQLNELGIYNMDIRTDNYLGGRLFDFSTAVTIPHISFSLDFRTQAQILEDIEYDLACFDAMIKPVIDQIDLTKMNRWENIRSRSEAAPVKVTETEPRRSHRLSLNKGVSKM